MSKAVGMTASRSGVPSGQPSGNSGGGGVSRGLPSGVPAAAHAASMAICAAESRISCWKRGSEGSHGGMYRLAVTVAMSPARLAAGGEGGAPPLGRAGSGAGGERGGEVGGEGGRGGGVEEGEEPREGHRAIVAR